MHNPILFFPRLPLSHSVVSWKTFCCYWMKICDANRWGDWDGTKWQSSESKKNTKIKLFSWLNGKLHLKPELLLCFIQFSFLNTFCFHNKNRISDCVPVCFSCACEYMCICGFFCFSCLWCNGSQWRCLFAWPTFPLSALLIWPRGGKSHGSQCVYLMGGDVGCHTWAWWLVAVTPSRHTHTHPMTRLMTLTWKICPTPSHSLGDH